MFTIVSGFMKFANIFFHEWFLKYIRLSEDGYYTWKWLAYSSIYQRYASKQQPFSDNGIMIRIC